MTRDPYLAGAAVLFGLLLPSHGCAPRPAGAQEAPWSPPDIKLVGPAGDCVERVRITNRVGPYNGAVTLETAHGPVAGTIPDGAALDVCLTLGVGG